MSLTQLASWYFGRRISAQLFWAGAYLAACLSAVNFLLRSYQPEIVMILGAQITQFFTAYLILMGVRSYLGLQVWPLLYGVLASVVMLIMATFFTLVEPNPALRIVLSSLVTGILFGLSTITMARGGIRRFPARYLFALPCCVHTIFVFARIGNAYQAEGVINLVQGATIPPFFILEAIISLVMMAFATLMLVSESITSELRRLAEVDSLTNTFNRRSFLTLLDKAVSAANRQQSALSVLLIDLDHFKQINDTYGHGTGDDVLCHFVGIASSCLRAEDVMGRIGGEEFAAFLPNAGMVDAQLIAERLRSRVAEQSLAGAWGDIRLTISIGIAQCLPGEPAELALHRADEAMYRAKEHGRNRVELWQLGDVVV
jgi:diguanylate cyclase (GGDEF)-like protein